MTVSSGTGSFEQTNHGIEFGSRTASPDTTEVPSTVILASYNIRYAVGQYLIASGMLRKVGINFPRRRPDAVARNIRLAGRAFSDGLLFPRPDILALQEADKETARSGRQHVAAKLADELEVPYVHAGAGIPREKPEPREWWLNFEEQIGLNDSGDTGVAILSRFSLTEIVRLDLPWHTCAWRPRLALAASIEIGGNKIRFVNVHIDPHASLDGQSDQLEVVLNHAEEHDGPRVIMGDFNTLSKQKAVEIRKLMESRGYTTPFPTGTPTWRGAGLRYHADWIFIRGVEVLRWGVARPLSVSDHWPIWAEIQLPISD